MKSMRDKRKKDRQRLRARSRAIHYAITRLEQRLLLCSQHLVEALNPALGTYPAIDVHIDRIPLPHIDQQPLPDSAVGGPSSGGAVTAPLSSIPQLHSLGSASAKLYLDFD